MTAVSRARCLHTYYYLEVIFVPVNHSVSAWNVLPDGKKSIPLICCWVEFLSTPVVWQFSYREPQTKGAKKVASDHVWWRKLFT